MEIMSATPVTAVPTSAILIRSTFPILECVHGFSHANKISILALMMQAEIAYLRDLMSDTMHSGACEVTVRGGVRCGH